MTRTPRLSVPAALIALALAATGCSSKPDVADVQPLIDQVLAASGATHVQSASLHTNGQLQLTIWDGSAASTWDVSTGAEPALSGQAPDAVPAGMTPVGEFDWTGLYDKAKAVLSKDCRVGGIRWTSLPNGQEQEQLFCNYTTYLAGSTTIDGLTIPDSLDSSTAAGLDEAFRLFESLMPEGGHRLDWLTPGEHSQIQLTAATTYQNAAGEECAMVASLDNMSAPLPGNAGGQVPPNIVLCVPGQVPVTIGTGTPATIAFQPATFGGQAMLTAYEQALSQARNPAEMYTTAEVWGQPDGTLVFHMAAGSIDSYDTIEIPLPS